MVALPAFSAGAMENWGLVTYRESTLLYEEGVSTASRQQRVCTIIAHELAHQVSVEGVGHPLSETMAFCLDSVCLRLLMIV